MKTSITKNGKEYCGSCNLQVNDNWWDNYCPRCTMPKKYTAFGVRYVGYGIFDELLTKISFIYGWLKGKFFVIPRNRRSFYKTFVLSNTQSRWRVLRMDMDRYFEGKK